MRKRRYWKVFLTLVLANALLIGAAQVACAQTNTNSHLSGLDIVIHTPPPGWNPLTASAQELSFYGYPARPQNSKQLQFWKKMVCGKWFKPSFARGTFGPSLLKKVSSTKNGQYVESTNWSGVASQQTFSQVAGYWIQPSVTADSADLPAYSSSWIGLGGYSSDSLIQCGTESSILSDGSGEYPVWWEIVGTSQDTGGEVFISNFSHNPGDTFYSDITFTTSSSAGTASFYIYDETSGASTSFEVSDITGYSGVTSSAEWIGERPTVGGTLPNLADFGTMYFSGAEAGTASNLDYYPQDGDSSTNYITMIDDYYNTLAEPSTLDSTGDFNEYWYTYN